MKLFRLYHHGENQTHIHGEEEKKIVKHRISKIIGHLEAIKKMIYNDDDCSQVLIQLSAGRSAINNTGKVVLKNHMNHCIVETVENNDQETIDNLNKAIDIFIK